MTLLICFVCRALETTPQLTMGGTMKLTTIKPRVSTTRYSMKVKPPGFCDFMIFEGLWSFDVGNATACERAEDPAQ